MLYGAHCKTIYKPTFYWQRNLGLIQNFSKKNSTYKNNGKKSQWDFYCRRQNEKYFHHFMFCNLKCTFISNVFKKLCFSLIFFLRGCLYGGGLARQTGQLKNRVYIEELARQTG